KLKSTYVDALPKLINPHTGRLHTTFTQTGTSTGRLASSDPNLQNIPVRSEIGKEIRRAFIAPKGYKLISADYSQIELRILAHLSGDPLLIDAFNKGVDIHAQTAAKILGVEQEEVTPNMRRLAKTINFGIIYGMSDYGLSKELGIHRREAKEYIENYFNTYSVVKEFLEKLKEEAREKGYVTTIFN
ncbi:MAG TPA: DNA polymerase, partial [bacterium]|nr:DNA polymerase [bacterium]